MRARLRHLFGAASVGAHGVGHCRAAVLSPTAFGLSTPCCRCSRGGVQF